MLISPISFIVNSVHLYTIQLNFLIFSTFLTVEIHFLFVIIEVLFLVLRYNVTMAFLKAVLLTSL